MDILNAQKSLRKFIDVCPVHSETQFSQVLDFPQKCDKCSNEEILLKREQEAAIAQRERMLGSMANNGINVVAKGFNEWEFDPNTADRQVKILENLKGYALNFNCDMPNLLFYGGTGAGKTMLTNALARAVFKQRFNQGSPYPAKFIKSAEIMRLCKEFWTDKTKPTEQMIVSNLGIFDLLVIDDLGDGDSTGNIANDRSRLGQIIDLRYQVKPTVITTNLSFDETKIFMGDRAWDRFQEKLVMIECNWASYRQQVAQVARW